MYRNEMIRGIIELFKKPSAMIVAQRDLEEAQRNLLEYQAQMEFSKSMVDYLKTKITRLKTYTRED